MDLFEILVILGVLLYGHWIGYLIGARVFRKSIPHNAVGRLRIDHSEPDEPTRMFVELKGVTPDMIAQNEYVVFEVLNESYISHN